MLRPSWTLCCTALLGAAAPPRAAAPAASKVADAIACELCGVISEDLFKSAIGIQGAGFGPTGFRFKEQLGGGDMIDVVDSLCHVEATPDWDEETQGVPPVSLQHGYVLWQDAEAGKYLVRRKDDVDESLIGLSIVDDSAASEIFLHSCEQHIRAIDVDIADGFSVALKRHRKALKKATAEDDYAFKEALAAADDIAEMHTGICSALCENADGDRPKKKPKKKKQKKKKGKKDKRSK